MALYPGSFDPITYGHLDVIERACQMFDRVTVAVLKHPHKIPLFTPEQRKIQIAQATTHLQNIEVQTFVGLTVSYAREKGAKMLIRGLRVLSDFEGELQMAHTNKTLAPELETVFLATSSKFSFLSSSLVKEIARYNGDIHQLVSPNVAEDLRRHFTA